MDLNADLGELPGPEGRRVDAQLLEQVTSANVACGFHAGDDATMRATCAGAVARGVRIGAHVGYADREGFGRRPLDVAPGDLEGQTAEQLRALTAAARAEGAVVAYLKPHGALYHRCHEDRDAALAVLRATAAFPGVAAVLSAPGSALLELAPELGLRPVREGFADRRYASAFRLAGRDEPGAVLGHDAATRQAVALATRGEVALQDGTRVALAVESICLHGDGPDAVTAAAGIVEALATAGVRPRPFA